MYFNPYSLVPGEKLDRQALFDRYLIWFIYAAEAKIVEIGPNCDPSLFEGHLCCEDHFEYSNQYDDFIRYFCHLRMISYFDPYVTLEKIDSWIQDYQLTFDPVQITKYMTIVKNRVLGYLSGYI